MLTDKEIRGLVPRDKPYKVSDGRQLYLYIRTGGGMSWRVNYQSGGVQKTMTLGTYPEVSLKEARLMRDALKLELAKSGVVKPKVKHAASGAVSFEKVAREWHKHQLNKWCDEYAVSVIESLQRHAFKSIGGLPIDCITPQQVLSITRKLEGEGKYDAATKIYQRIRSVFTYGIAAGVCGTNPAASVQGALAARPAPVGRRALPLHLLHELLNKLDDYPNKVTSNLIRMTILTMCRPSEVRLMVWEELDLARELWVIPPERMKMRKEHIVPLTTGMVDIITAQQAVKLANSEYVFTTLRKPTAFSDAAVNQALRIMGYGEVAHGHGFRAMASTALNESGLFAPDIIEACLAHVAENKVRAVYNRAKYMPARIALMTAWDRFITARKSDPEAVLHL